MLKKSAFVRRSMRQLSDMRNAILTADKECSSQTLIQVDESTFPSAALVSGTRVRKISLSMHNVLPSTRARYDTGYLRPPFGMIATLLWH